MACKGSLSSETSVARQPQAWGHTGRPWQLAMSIGCIIVACIFNVTSAVMHLGKLERHGNPEGLS